MTTRSKAERIRACIVNHPAGLTPDEIGKLLPDVARTDIDTTISRLIEDGVIYRVTRGFYRPYED